MDEATYDKLAERELTALLGALDQAGGDAFQAELESGILTVEFDDRTRYVINSHRAARQIWMAAERAAWHFDYEPSDERWRAQKSGDELWSAVEQVLTKKLGRAIDLR